MFIGSIAVHCRAGLGRTGTIIGLWLMDNHDFKAKEAIGWMRFNRNGMVIGQQADYLVKNEPYGTSMSESNFLANRDIGYKSQYIEIPKRHFGSDYERDYEDHRQQRMSSYNSSTKLRDTHL